MAPWVHFSGFVSSKDAISHKASQAGLQGKEAGRPLGENEEEKNELKGGSGSSWVLP